MRAAPRSNIHTLALITGRKRRSGVSHRMNPTAEADTEQGGATDRLPPHRTVAPHHLYLLTQLIAY